MDVVPKLDEPQNLHLVPTSILLIVDFNLTMCFTKNHTDVAAHSENPSSV